MKRKIGILIFIIIMILGISNYSQASSFNLDISADKTEIEAGEEAEINIKLTNIDMGEKGINVVEGTLEYDKDVIENIQFEGIDEWKRTYNNEEGKLKGKFLLDKMSEGIKEEESISSIKLKIKEDAKQGETQIKIKDIKSNDGESLVDTEDKVITLKISNTNEEKQNVKTGDNILLVVGLVIAVIMLNVIITIVRKKNKK